MKTEEAKYRDISKCSKCRYWRLISHKSGYGEGVIGECRRRSPAIGPNQYPATGGDHWCGDFAKDEVFMTIELVQ